MILKEYISCHATNYDHLFISLLYYFLLFIFYLSKVWEEIITHRLNENEVFGNRLGSKRAVRDRYSLLAKKYRKKMTEEAKASGISPELTETD